MSWGRGAGQLVAAGRRRSPHPPPEGGGPNGCRAVAPPVSFAPRLRRRRWGDHKVAPFISRPPHPPPTSAVCGRRSPSRRVASTRPAPGPPQSAGAAPTTRRCGTPFVRALLSFLAVSFFLFLCPCRYRVVHTCRHSPWHPRHTHTASRMSADAHHPARPATHRCGPLWPPHPRQAQPPHLLSSDLPHCRARPPLQTALCPSRTISPPTPLHSSPPAQSPPLESTISPCAPHQSPLSKPHLPPDRLQGRAPSPAAAAHLPLPFFPCLSGPLRLVPPPSVPARARRCGAWRSSPPPRPWPQPPAAAASAAGGRLRR